MMHRSTGRNPGVASFSSEKSSRLRSGIAAAGLGAALMSTGAMGQTAATAPGPELQEIIVTGSLIKRIDVETPSPVQVLSATDIAQMGYTNVSQVLANLSANGQGTLNQSFSGAFASGGSGVALRGLTVGGTLTLIDGQRMVAYPISDDNQRSFVDVSAIPINAVERVEVLKDGASAIYGADAIAGVVNIILKKSYTGTEFTAEAGTSQHHDGTTEHLAGISGIGDLASDGYNAYVAVDYHHTDQILATNRNEGFTNLNFSSLPGGLNTTPGAFGNPNVAYPGSITGYLVDPTTGLPTAFLPGCSAAAQELQQCTYRNKQLQLQPSTGQTNVIGKFTKALAADWTTSATVSLFNSKAEQVGAYPTTSLASGGVQALSVFPGGFPTVVSTPPYTVPGNYPGNTTGTTQNLVYNFPEIGGSDTLTNTNTYRFIWDIKGSAAGWDVDGSLGVMYARMQLKELNLLSTALVQPALNNGYVVGPNASPTAAQALVPEAISDPTSSLDTADIHATRTLFNLPGGPFAVALGAQFFHKVENDLPPPTVLAGAVEAGNPAFALGSQNDASAFMELNAQVLKSLEIDGAVRYDNYNNGVGGSTTPKVSVKYKPVDMFVLRGTWGKGFRAPSIAESSQSGNFFFAGATNDPILCPNPGTPTAKGNFPSQCNIFLTGFQQPGTNLKPVKSTNETFGFIVEPSPVFSLSADYYQIKLTNDIISVLEAGGITSYTSLVRAAPATLPFCSADGVCTNTAVTPVGLAGFGAFPYVNAGATQTEGVDLDWQSHIDLGDFGKITAELNYTHILEYNETFGGVEYHLAGTHGPSGISGDTGNPKDRAVFTLGWEKGPVTVSATVNYTSHFSITDPSSGVLNCESGLLFDGRFQPSNTVPAYACTIRTFVDTNLYTSYAITDQLMVHGAITNAFNRQPPIDYQTYGGGGGNAYDASLHQEGAVGRFFLVGATYKFK
ncbi:MAG TPA: TonB-dependent receptor [Steroidobacteraceae bacterium]|nr:TonB-dependent receptor [Steroidobacteraceae bacterium]